MNNNRDKINMSLKMLVTKLIFFFFFFGEETKLIFGVKESDQLFNLPLN